MNDLYLTVWSGGYDMPQYEAFRTEGEALHRAFGWAKDIEEGVDTIDVLRINLDTLEIELVEDPAKKGSS